MDESMQHNNGTPPVDTVPPPLPKSRRIPWVGVAVILIVLGISLFAIGWISGSRGGRIHFDRGIRVETGTREEFASGSGNFTFTNNYDTVVINASSHAIRVYYTNEPTVRVVTPPGLRSNISEQGSVLNVDVRASFVGGGHRIHFMGFGGGRGVTWNRNGRDTYLNFDFDFSNPRNMFGGIRVYVPNSVNDVYARTSSGSVRINGISTTQLRAQTSSGRVELNGGTHQNAHLQSTSGSVNADAYFTGGLYARTTSGSVNVTDSNVAMRTTGQIQLRSTSGSVRYYTRAPLNNFNYRISVTSGSMRVDGSRISGRSATGGADGGTQLNASTTSGSVRLNFSQR